MNLFKGLNDRQKEAVMSCDTNLRIIAGAGSGKTKVITTRIAYLVEDMGVAPYRILAITFTNKAANEMKSRVEGILGVNDTGVRISTIHSFCVRVLREEIRFFDYPSNFLILDSDDQKTILNEIYKKLDIQKKELSYGNALNYISGNKCAFISADEALQRVTYPFEKIKAQIYSEYENKLKMLQVLDFDDLLIYVYKLFRDNLEAREKWQNRFDFIHVDEFQDVDEIQYGLIRYLCGPSTKLCVVGDPDQTIYTWRGAKVDIIMNFVKDFKDCKTIILNENYRSTKNILDAANSLIKNNLNRVDKDLYTNQSGEAKVTYYASTDESYEALWIAKKIIIMHQEGVPYREIAVLYRSNYLSRTLEKVLLDAHIPYRIYGGVKFFDRAEIKDALSYLRLLITGNRSYSEFAVKRIINMPRRGIGVKTMENIEMISNSYDEDYFDVLCKHSVARGKVQAEIDKFCKLINDTRAMKEDYSISILLKKLLEESGYISYLENANENERLDNINELLSDINTYEENDPEGSLEDYLQMISLYTDTQDTSDGKFVQLMSVHAAKGLEFDNVFVYSLCEGVFPNEKSINEGGNHALEEERRLAYVAFTRARKQLFLTSSTGYSFVTQRMKTPSRFISEIGKEKLEYEGEVLNSYPNRQESRWKDNTPNDRESNKKRNSITLNDRMKKKSQKIKKGDLVEHKSFGEGVVVSIKDGVATIAFDKRFGIKRLAADHPSIKVK